MLTVIFFCLLLSMDIPRDVLYKIATHKTRASLSFFLMKRPHEASYLSCAVPIDLRHHPLTTRYLLEAEKSASLS